MSKRRWYDRMLGAFGLRRAGTFASAYKGASTGNTMRDWVMGPTSADQTIRPSLTTLRDRARELVINDPVAARIPKLFSENIVGENGFTLQAKIGTTRKTPNASVNARLETAFYDWAENYCTVDGRHSFAEVQSMAAENEVVDGEFIVRLVRGFDNPYGFALELIDPDQLDHNLNVAETGRGTSIRMGVEVDRWRRPVTYWVLKQHPSERGARDYHQIPAADVVHLYVSSRPQQTRGVTQMAPVILNIKMLSGGREAVLVAMRASACNFATYETTDGFDPPVREGEDPANSGVIPTEVEPGAGYQLPPGIKANFNNPPFADAAFDPFELGQLRSIAQAIGVSYASLTGDVTQASYGSQRAAMLPEQAAWRKHQRRVVLKLLTPIYRAWVREALLSGALQVDSFDPVRYYEVAFHARPFEWIDPLKDAEAEDVKVGMGIQTRTRIANTNGDDYRELIDEQAEEIKYARDHGVPLFIAGVDVTGQIAQPAASPRGATAERDAKDKNENAPSDKAARLRVVGDE